MAKSRVCCEAPDHKRNPLFLRRSHRLPLREPFRLEALPQELRSIRYSFAVYHESQVESPGEYQAYPRLGARPCAIALALSHVFRSLLADSVATFYAETTFFFVKWPSTPPLLPMILRWVRTWGLQAALYIRSLIIADQSLSPDCDQFRFDFNDS